MAETFFDGQRDGEQILQVWRRNPVTTLKEGLTVVGATLLVVASMRFLGASLVTSLAFGVWLTVVPLYTGITWYRWWNDLYVLTNQRLVDVDQKRLFHRAVAEAPLENIQDVSFETRGIIQTLLNYGTVMVQTAAVTTEIDIIGVTDPQAIQQLILRTVQSVKREHRREGREIAAGSEFSDHDRFVSTHTQLG